MIAVDTNLLVYAHRAGGPFHERARACLATLAEGPAQWGLPWTVVHEFLAITTNPRVFRDPTPLGISSAAVEAWLSSPRVVTLAEPTGYWQILRSLAQGAAATGSRIHDARIAATCLAHGVQELWTADRDFGRFPSLRIRNPLVGD